jgi:cell wall assembly regulator SMI1
MNSSTTLLDAKAAFLRQQVRLLSQPLQPSKSWRDFAPETETSLSDATVSAVMVRVNEKLKQHNKNVYSALSQRHVAEQIDALYWNEVQEQDKQTDANALAVGTDVNLMESEEVGKLPEEIRELQVHEGQPISADEAQRYVELRRQLVEASVRRDQQRKRLEGYKQLQKLLEPLERAQENVQPNLVTRDGELSKELDRMRVLLARVTGKVGEVKRKNGNVKDLGQGLSEQQRLQAAMDLT